MEDVYIARVGALSARRNTESKIQALCTAAGIETMVSEGDLTASQGRLGERGNDAFVSTLHVAAIVRQVKNAGAKSFLTDTSTLYLGGRECHRSH